MASAPKNEHGQYFTPRPVADLMVSLLTADKHVPILEPCAGAGVFLDALQDEGFSAINAVEIDSRLAESKRHEIENCSFVSWKPCKEYAAVIGNPPYIRWRNLSDASRDELQAHTLWGSLFNSLSDYLTVFVAASIEALKDGGELIFITPSFWMHTQHSEQLREWMLARGAITHLVSFGEAEVFPKVSSSIIIFRFVRGETGTSDIEHYRYVGRRRVPSEGLSLTNETLFQHELVPAFSPGNHWTLASEAVQNDLATLETACSRPASGQLFENADVQRLGDYVDIANGMVSGLDKAFRLPEVAYPQLNEDERSALLPVVKGFQLSPLVTADTCWYINIPIGLTEDEAKSTYPSLLSILAPYRENLEARYSYGRDLPHWEWAFRRSEKYFLNGERKAMVPCKERLTNKDRVRISLAPRGAVATQDVTAFSPRENVRESLEYIVAYLNNPLVTEWVLHRGLMKGGVAEFSERPLASIPFRAINWIDPSEVHVHDEITSLLRESAETPLDVLQDKIDGLVNSLLVPNTA